MKIEIFLAKLSEAKDVENLLNECKLSTEGLSDYILDYYLAKVDNKIVGSIGVEIYKKYGVIRSTAVHPQYQKKGIGAQLAQKIFEYAKNKGVEELYLKTEAETEFFTRVGFSIISPDQIPNEINHSPNLLESCCSNADTMVLSLKDWDPGDYDSIIKKAVKDKYSDYAKTFTSAAKQSSSCCGSSEKSAITKDLYDSIPDDIPAEALAASLGCGNPLFLAQVEKGEVILDLGSGGGLDVLLSAKRTGPTGKAYGLDMTDEMLELARQNQEKAGAKNVEFLKGQIEDVPLPSHSIDLIISNCVVNLSSNKDKVLSETFRLLKPGGRIAISDIVFLKEIPPVIKKNMAAWAGCISGALEEREYLSKLENAGFENISIEITRTYLLSDFEKYPGFQDLDDEEKKHLEGAMTASFVRASKPMLKEAALISTYEAGFQPLLISTASASLIANGIVPDSFDLFMNKSDKKGINNYKFIGIALALFDSLESGVSIAKEIRENNPDAYICFYGPYAILNKDKLLKYGNSCIIGDWEKPIADLTKAIIEEKDIASIDGVYSEENKSKEFKFFRDECVVPARNLLPSICTYQNTFIENIVKRKMKVGNVETSRGCHHKCKFCSVYASTSAKVKFITEDVILADVDQLVKSGIEHITFVDAEFINSIKFSLSVVNEIHNRYPHLTYDFTTRVDHIDENEDKIPEFKRTGCIAITTSIEFPSLEVLNKLQKDITLDQIVKCMNTLKKNGIQANTTFVTFNPWVGLEELMNLSDFIKSNELGDVIDPVQYETRLHLYKGSPLLKDKIMADVKLTEREFHYEWEHPDERVEQVFQKMVKPTVEGEFKRCCVRC